MIRVNRQKHLRWMDGSVQAAWMLAEWVGVDQGWMNEWLNPFQKEDQTNCHPNSD